MSNFSWPRAISAGHEQLEVAFGLPWGAGDTAAHREGDASVWQERPLPDIPQKSHISSPAWDFGRRSPHGSPPHFTSCHPADSKKHLPRLKAQGRGRSRREAGREEPPGRAAPLEGAPLLPWQLPPAAALAQEPKGVMETWKPLSE